mgnify:FL=1
MEARIAICLLLGVLIVWVLSPFQPGGPYRNFNDKVISSCELGNPKITVRLYEGGGGALVEDHYIATAHPQGAQEAEFFWAIGSPSPQAVLCNGDDLTVQWYQSVVPLTFSTQKIETLRGYPVHYYHGKLSAAGGRVFPEAHHYVAAFILGLVGWILYRGYKPKPSKLET